MTLSRGKHSVRPRTLALALFVLLTVAVIAVCAVACGDSTPATSAAATPTSAAAVDETTAVEETTTESVADEVTTTQSTEGQVTDTSAGGTSSVRTLGENDSGHEIVLKVGDRVRIELQPYVNDRVKSVEWNYEPIVVRETDAGADVISDVVVECWLELEATIAGPVTVRAEYEYPYGTRQTAWVAYFIVRE
jgi:hypothetical protein